MKIAHFKRDTTRFGVNPNRVTHISVSEKHTTIIWFGNDNYIMVDGSLEHVSWALENPEKSFDDTAI